MCLKCYQAGEGGLIQSLSSLDDSSFSKFNTTSVDTICLAASGMSGLEIRHLALNVLERFVAWRKTKPDKYFPSTGMESMYSAEEIEAIRVYFAEDDKSDGQKKCRADLIKDITKELQEIRSHFPRPTRLMFTPAKKNFHWTHFVIGCIVIVAYVSIFYSLSL